MCLGVPGRVVSEPVGDLRLAKVEFGGIVKEICLAYVPEATAGDYVVVHVGFAIARVAPAEAARVFSYLDELDQLGELQRAGES